MGERILKGKDETITFEEADRLADAATTELLFYICGTIDEASDDEEERAQAKVTMATLVGKAMNASRLAGLLCDPDSYLKATFPEGAVASIEGV